MARKIDVFSFAIALVVLSSPHVEAQTAGSAEDSNQGAAAQPALSATLQEVVVTARKRKEDIQNVPVSMVAIVGDQLTAQHVQSIDDIKASVPNLNITTSETPDVPDVVLRGIGSFDVTQAVGFYVDEVQQFQGSAVPFEDIERVEVLRGPQGTLYGGSNIGGAIKYVTKLPTDTFSSLVSVDGGGEGTRNYTAVISGPIAGESLLGRFTYFNDHTDGFVYDTTLNERVDRSDFRGGRLTLELKGDGTSAIAHLYFAELEGLSLDALYIADSDHTYSTQAVFDTPPILDHRTENADLHVEHQLGWATLTSVSAMTFANDFNFGDFDLSQYPISTGVTDTRERDYSQELRLTSSGNSSLQWITGLFYLHRNILFNQDFAQNLAPPPFVPTDFAHFFSYTDEFAAQEAAYANVTYGLGRWSLEAGTRIEHDKDTVQVLPSNSNPAFAEESLANTVNLPLASVSYHLTPHYMTYASIARGFAPGGEFDGALGLTAFHPETTLNYELGLKGMPLGGRINFSVDAFYIDYKDRVFQQQTVQPPNPNIKSNLGDSHNYGGEGSLRVRVTSGLTLSVAGGFTAAKWYRASYVDPVTHLPVSLDGLTGPFTPAYQASLGVDWQRKLSDRLAVGLHADDSVQGRTYWDPQDLRAQRAYNIANVGAHLAIGEHWEINITAQNVFNTRYNTIFFYGPALGAPYDVAKLGRPRLITGRISWTY